VSGETEKEESGWTTDTLHAHIVALFEAVWRELTLLRDRMAHDFRLQDERMTRQWDEEKRRVEIALTAHETALQVQRETALRETDIAARTAKDAVDAALAAHQEAIRVQASALQAYDAKQNEWRGSLNDLGTRMMPRSEAEAAIQRATERIQEIVLAQASVVTRLEMDTARQSDQARLTELTDRVTRAEGMAAGGEAKLKGIYATLAAFGSLVVIATTLVGFIIAR
jgi:hypothetical protein